MGVTATDRIRPIRHVITWWASIVVVLLIALGGVTLALVAESHSSKTATCVNNGLAVRTAPDHVTDNQAIQDYIAAQHNLGQANKRVSLALTEAIAAKTDAQKTQANTDFVTAFLAQRPVADAADRQTSLTQDTLKANQAWRDAHPLGKC